jgi:hypothetical protein
MENPTPLEDADFETAGTSAHATPRANAAPIDWHPPTTRLEAEATILSLSNDIGLILAQLSEDQVAWCQRTGRSPYDYAAWRRRALFAKVHKEHQLRECKRIRFQLTDHAAEVDNAEVLLSRLVAECHRVIDAWRLTPSTGGDRSLDMAMSRLAELVADDEREVHVPVDLVGTAGDNQLAG